MAATQGEPVATTVLTVWMAVKMVVQREVSRGKQMEA